MLTINIDRIVVNTMQKIDKLLEQDNQYSKIQEIKAAMKEPKSKRMYQRYRVFLNFLQNILKLYSVGRIVIMLDNSRIHHTKLLKPFLQEHKDRLTFIFLPPYSPKLNLITVS